MKSERARILGLGALSWGIIASISIITVEGSRFLTWRYSRETSTREEEYPAATRYMDRVEAELSKPDPTRPDWAGRYLGNSEILEIAPTNGYVSFHASDIGESYFQFGRVRETDGHLHLYNRHRSDFMIVHQQGEVTLVADDSPSHCFIKHEEGERLREAQARRLKLCPPARL